MYLFTTPFHSSVRICKVIRTLCCVYDTFKLSSGAGPGEEGVSANSWKLDVGRVKSASSGHNRNGPHTNGR